MDDPDELQDGGGGDRLAALLRQLRMDARELRRGAGALRLLPPLHELGDHLAGLDPARPRDRDPGGLVDGVRPLERHAPHPDVDALHQDAAGGGRALSDFALVRRVQPARYTHWSDRRAHADQPAVSILKAQTLNQLGKNEQAISDLQSAYQLRPDSYPIAISLAKLMSANNQAQKALSDIQRWSERRPSDPIIWNQLAETANAASELILSYRAKSEFFYLSGQKNKAIKQLNFAIEYAEKQGSFQQQARLKQRLLQITEANESLNL